MGISFASFIRLNADCIAKLQGLAGLSEYQMSEMLSWTGVPSTPGMNLFRGTEFVSRSIHSEVFRGCHICLREDALKKPSNPLSTMALRGDWQFREVRVCVRHASPLTPLWTAKNQRERADVTERLKPIVSDVLSDDFLPTSTIVTPYDNWLHQRLIANDDQTWLACLDTYSAATVCQVLGEILWQGETNVKMMQDLHQLGFDNARQGPPKIIEALEEAQNRSEADPADERFRTASLNLPYYHVRSLDRPCFDPFISVLRNFSVTRYPHAAGDIIFGEKLPKRFLHSISTAASEIRIDPTFLAAILEEVGAVNTNDPRPFSLRLFSAQEYGPLLEEISLWVRPAQVKKALGLTGREFNALVTAGAIEPRSHIPDIRRKWLVSEAAKFVSNLEAKSTTISAHDDEWQTLISYHSSTGITMNDLLRAIDDGRLTLGRQANNDQFSRFRLRASDVHAVLGHLEDKIEDGWIGLSEFGKSIGVRSASDLQALRDVGTIQLTEIRHPGTGHPQSVLTRKAQEDFHSKFLTPNTMKKEFGTHSRTCVLHLKRAGVQPYRLNGQYVEKLYLREEAENVLTTIAAGNI